jgi:hypothetical protein
MTKNTCCFFVYGPFRELLPIVLGFRGDLQRPWQSVHVSEAWPKTRRFCVLGPFSWAIAHSFGVPEWFTRSMTLSTYLRGMAKSSSFLRFRPFSWAIAHCFWVPVIFTRNMTVCLSTCLRGMAKNSSFLGRFHELLPTVLGFRGDLQGPWQSVHVWEVWPKPCHFCVLGPFSWAIAHSFGVPE